MPYSRKIGKKNLEKTEKKFARKEFGHFNEVGRKIILIFFCFNCATQNNYKHDEISFKKVLIIECML